MAHALAQPPLFASLMQRKWRIRLPAFGLGRYNPDALFDRIGGWLPDAIDRSSR
jgi:hypothetical protein